MIRQGGSRQIANHPSASRPHEFHRIEFHRIGFHRIGFHRIEDHPCRRRWSERRSTEILPIERPKSADRSVDRLRWDATNGRHLPMTTNDENAETRP